VGDNLDFQKYYSVIEEEKDRRMYKLNQSVVIEYAKEHNLDSSKIPSLNPSIADWNPDTIEKEMHMMVERDN
jgi:hypothetical protein